MRSARICPAPPHIVSVRQVVYLLEQVENDRAEDHEFYNFHGESACGAGVARRESWR
jgi:hypothetical protein